MILYMVKIEKFFGETRRMTQNSKESYLLNSNPLKYQKISLHTYEHFGIDRPVTHVVNLDLRVSLRL